MSVDRKQSLRALVRHPRRVWVAIDRSNGEIITAGTKRWAVLWANIADVVPYVLESMPARKAKREPKRKPVPKPKQQSSAEFWAYAEKCAARVKRWPASKRAGINV